MKNVSYSILLLLFALLMVNCGGDKATTESTDAIADEAPTGAKPLMAKTPGIQTYSFRASFAVDVAATLDTIRDFGFTEVECGLDPYGLTTEEFKAMLDERGIKAVSVGAGYDEVVKNPAEIARKTKILGASYVMVAWIPHKGNDFTLENAQKAVEDFNAAGKVLRENGITLCYHTHGYEFRPHEGGTLFDYIMENTNPEYVSFEMDIMWVFFPGADPVALLNKYGNRWKLMHLKDLKKGVEGNDTGGTDVRNDVALGTGQIPLPEVLRAAKNAGVEYYFIEDESPSVTQQVPQSLEYLKSLTE
ncbi:MAG: sugar phosphate isomerase/epimerase [Cyclobacteriaceae bacterium]|nr:sugar phosphate isomerase/epimerase [Cyclobacteriaceae bacterium]